MALFHLSVKVIKRSGGKSAVAAAAYRAAEKIKNERDGKTHDFTRKQGVVHRELMLAPGAGRWNRAQLWNAAEATEKRGDAQVAREVEFSLPIEAQPNERLKLAREFVKDNFVSRGMCADLCIHDTGTGNPHAHVLLTMREVSDGHFLNKKNRDWNRKELVEEWRADWASRQNDFYREAGLYCEVDHRSYARQGLNKVAQIHEGPTVTQAERKAAKKGKLAVTRCRKINEAIKTLNEANNSISLLSKSIKNVKQAEEQSIKQPLPQTQTAEVEQTQSQRQVEKPKAAMPAPPSQKTDKFGFAQLSSLGAPSAAIGRLNRYCTESEKYAEKYVDDEKMLTDRLAALTKLRGEVFEAVKPKLEGEYRRNNPPKLIDVENFKKAKEAASKAREQAEAKLNKAKKEQAEINNSWWKKMVYEVKPSALNALAEKVGEAIKAERQAGWAVDAAEKSNKESLKAYEDKLPGILQDRFNSLPATKAIDRTADSLRKPLAVILESNKAKAEKEAEAEKIKKLPERIDELKKEIAALVKELKAEKAKKRPNTAKINKLSVKLSAKLKVLKNLEKKLEKFKSKSSTQQQEQQLGEKATPNRQSSFFGLSSAHLANVNAQDSRDSIKDAYEHTKELSKLEREERMINLHQ